MGGGIIAAGRVNTDVILSEKNGFLQQCSNKVCPNILIIIEKQLYNDFHLFDFLFTGTAVSINFSDPPCNDARHDIRPVCILYLYNL